MSIKNKLYYLDCGGGGYKDDYISQNSTNSSLYAN